MRYVDDSSFEDNFNLRNKEGDYNLLAELLADKNNIPFSFVKFNGTDKSDFCTYFHAELGSAPRLVDSALRTTAFAA